MSDRVESARAIPLTGADCMLRAFDAEIRRTAGASHVSQLVLRLGPGFDTGRFEKLIEQAALAQPILRAPIRRRFFVGAPIYRVAEGLRRPLPAIRVIDAEPAAGGEAPLPEAFTARLNQRMASTRGELLRFDVVRYARGAAGTDLAISWMHMLFDGSGSETFVRWLDECSRGVIDPSELFCPTEFEPVRSSRSLRERGDGAIAWQRGLSGFAARPAASLAGPLRTTKQELRYTRIELSPQQTSETSERAKGKAGFLTPMLFYLAAAIRAHHAVLRGRGAVPPSYVVPVAVNLRPKGSSQAMFRTHVSMLWFQALPEQAEDLDSLIEALKQQRLAAIGARQIENGAAAMDFARFAPARLYTHMARRDFGGELSSFFFAFTGEFLQGMDRFLGAEIVDGFHVAPVPPSPGSCVAIHLRAGRLNVTHTYQQGVLSADEHELFRAQFLADFGT